MELWQNACGELEKLQEIERVSNVSSAILDFKVIHMNSLLLLGKKRGQHEFYLLQEKDGELKGRTRAMTSLQVTFSVVPYRGFMSC